MYRINGPFERGVKHILFALPFSKRGGDGRPKPPKGYKGVPTIIANSMPKIPTQPNILLLQDSCFFAKSYPSKSCHLDTLIKPAGMPFGRIPGLSDRYFREYFGLDKKKASGSTGGF